jgi:methionyl-tRNA formyltransferase
MRLIFMGTPHFAVPTLKMLVECGHEIVAVYTQPPRPKNRGHHMTQSPVHEVAESLGLPVYTPASFKDENDQRIFQELNADAAIVVAYGLILKKPLLEGTQYGCFNIHGSLLPRWRGAAPIHRAMLSGDEVTGITIMKMDEGLDTGDMILKEEYALLKEMSFAHVHDDLSLIGARLMVEVLKDLEKGHLNLQKQDESQATYATKIRKEEGHLDFNKPADDILRCVRVLNPWPGTYLYHHNEMLKVHECEATIFPSNNEKHGMYLGEGYVQCKDAVVKITKIQRSGGKALHLEDFLRGYSLQKGEIFG